MKIALQKLFHNKWIRYIAGIALCCIYIILGHMFWGGGIDEQLSYFNNTKTPAKVIEVLQITRVEGTEDYTLTLSCKITRGNYKGEVREVTQKVNETALIKEKQADAGDTIFIRSDQGDADWYFVSYNRSNILLLFVVLFILSVLLLGSIQGFRIILSLVFTILAVFYVFVPAVLEGHNVYIHTLITSFFIIFMTLFLVYGFHKKSFIAQISCLIGILISLLLVWIVQKLLHLSGVSVLSDESVITMYYELGGNIDFHAIIYSSMIIGATGAIMDIAISVVTALEELHEKNPGLSSKVIWRSGIKLGRDFIGTMANTLILAYMGGAVIDVLLLVTTYGSVEGILNSETVIIEIMSSVIGSMGLIGTIPIATFLCSKVYNSN